LYLSLSVTQVNILTRVVVNNLYDQRKGCARRSSIDCASRLIRLQTPLTHL
jgi:hypothetical protein